MRFPDRQTIIKTAAWAASEAVCAGLELYSPWAGYAASAAILAGEGALGKKKEEDWIRIRRQPLKRKLGLITTYQGDGAACRVADLTPEDFDRMEGEELRAAREISDPARLDALVDTAHVVNVETNEWFFEHLGNTTHRASGPRVSDIPYAPLRQQARDAYLRVKMSNEPAYSYVERASEKTWRRLILPQADTGGRVQRLIVIAMHENAGQIGKQLAA